MYKWLQAKPGLALGAGLAMGLLIGVGMLIGALAAASYWASPQRAVAETLLHASTAQGSDSFAMATGPMDENVEGVFLLDFITGDLQCWVISPRTGQINAFFRHNVTKDVGAQRGKMPKYLMATGGAVFLAGGGARRMGNAVVYVADATSGVVCAYAVPYDHTKSNAGIKQMGPLMLLDRGKARQLEIRK
jgi:hypothetical protein